MAESTKASMSEINVSCLSSVSTNCASMGTSTHACMARLLLRHLEVLKYGNTSSLYYAVCQEYSYFWLLLCHSGML